MIIPNDIAALIALTAIFFMGVAFIRSRSRDAHVNEMTSRITALEAALDAARSTHHDRLDRMDRRLAILEDAESRAAYQSAKHRARMEAGLEAWAAKKRHGMTKNAYSQWPERVVLDGQGMQRCTSCGAIHADADDMCARCQQTVRLVNALGPDEYRRRRTARTLPAPLDPAAVDAFLDGLAKKEPAP